MGSMEVKKDKNSEEKGKFIWWAIGVKDLGEMENFGIEEFRNREFSKLEKWK